LRTWYRFLIPMVADVWWSIERLLSGWWANECVVVEKLLVVRETRRDL
jgi:hypothetical protein